ncbi:MAG: twin-arginine translocase TatA/TatE family subunit [Gemmatimonadales bacterium]|nr:twin-arginine translocase TatA/TatE family subunit [Gemmatimonadales bacterium]
MLGNLGFWEIALIGVIVLLVFGAKRLPEVGASLGKGIREFKRSLSDTQDALMSEQEPNRLPPRQVDAAPGAPTGGEPKRLSQ